MKIILEVIEEAERRIKKRSDDIKKIFDANPAQGLIEIRQKKLSLINDPDAPLKLIKLEREEAQFEQQLAKQSGESGNRLQEESFRLQEEWNHLQALKHRVHSLI